MSEAQKQQNQNVGLEQQGHPHTSKEKLIDPNLDKDVQVTNKILHANRKDARVEHLNAEDHSRRIEGIDDVKARDVRDRAGKMEPLHIGLSSGAGGEQHIPKVHQGVGTSGEKLEEKHAI